MLISEQYREQQKVLHHNAGYGIASLAYAAKVLEIINHYQIRNVLDYGAGKGRLGEALFQRGYVGNYLPYDPAIDYWASKPSPCEMVACIDVLEHIEPECLDAVLDDLVRCTRRVAAITVHTGPAKKVLPDGRNAHLTQQPMEWWQNQLASRFAIKESAASGNGAFFCVEPLP